MDRLEHVWSGVPNAALQLENGAVCLRVVFTTHDVEGAVDIRRSARPATADRHARASRPLVGCRGVDLHSPAPRSGGILSAAPATKDVDLWPTRVRAEGIEMAWRQ